jgi:hypothetical protein
LVKITKSIVNSQTGDERYVVGVIDGTDSANTTLLGPKGLDVQYYPTIFFINRKGEHKIYDGSRDPSTLVNAFINYRG